MIDIEFDRRQLCLDIYQIKKNNKVIGQVVYYDKIDYLYRLYIYLGKGKKDIRYLGAFESIDRVIERLNS